MSKHSSTYDQLGASEDMDTLLAEWARHANVDPAEVWIEPIWYTTKTSLTPESYPKPNWVSIYNRDGISVYFLKYLLSISVKYHL